MGVQAAKNGKLDPMNEWYLSVWKLSTDEQGKKEALVF